MGLHEHTDALPTEAGATVNCRVLPGPSAGSRGPAATIPHLLGRFRVLGEIARGGMGVVLRVYDPSLDRELAVKLLSPVLPPDSEAGRRLAQEARVVSQLRHPGIVPVFDVGSLPDGRAYFAMPYIDGQTLATQLADRSDHRHDLVRWLRVFERVCETVAHAHREGVVHRDLKPSNVMVGRSGEVVVMDWGVAALVDRPVASRPGVWVFGTPAYMPPEQARGMAETPEIRSDVFGLGAILCEILTGQPPYTGLDVAAVTRMAADGDLTDAVRRIQSCGADPMLVRLARRCLSADRSDRPASAGQVGRTVTDYLSIVDGRVRTATDRSLAASERRDRRFAGLVTAVLVLGASATVAASAREHRARATHPSASPDAGRVLTSTPRPPADPPARP